MSLILERPLAVFDLETTGINITKDRIVEIAIIRLEVDGSESSFCKRVNPGIPIPPEITAIIGISDDDIASEPKFEEIAEDVVAFIDEADLAGYNSNKFDIPVLAEELMRANSTFDISNRNFVDVQNIFHRMEQRTLSAAYQFYCNQELLNAHSALHDTKATVEVLKAQLERYETLSGEIPFLAEFSRGSNYILLDFAGRLAVNEDGEAIYNFGKHKGKTIKEVMNLEPGYYGWMLDADFPLYTKQCLRKEMEKIRAERAEKKDTDMQSKLDALKNKFRNS
jgi:DNA polymerase-3 subunit epsilon